MHATVRWTSGMTFDAGTGSGGHILLDASPESGGRGPTPMEALLAALGGCTGIDVVSILQKMRAPLQGLEVRVSGERAAEHPRVFTRVELEYVFTGPELRPDQVRRAVMLSQERYCPVSAMIRKATDLHHRWRIEGTSHQG
jgi:putative redox protein